MPDWESEPFLGQESNPWQEYKTMVCPITLPPSFTNTVHLNLESGLKMKSSRKNDLRRKVWEILKIQFFSGLSFFLESNLSMQIFIQIIGAEPSKVCLAIEKMFFYALCCCCCCCRCCSILFLAFSDEMEEKVCFLEKSSLCIFFQK